MTSTVEPLATLAGPDTGRDDERLSFSEWTLWQQYHGSSSLPLFECARHIPMALRISGRVDIAALATSVRELVTRHAVLRSAIAVRDGRPVRTVLPAAGESLSLVDLKSLARDRRAGGAQGHVADYINAPFDLERDGLCRTALFLLGGDEYLFVWVLHHMAVDVWSAHLLVRELSSRYCARLAGAPLGIPRTVGYGDYVQQQHARLCGSAGDRLLAYWTERLHGLAEPSAPLRRAPPPSASSSRSARHRFEIASEQVAGLDRLRRDAQTTMGVAVLGAFALLMHEACDSRAIVIGVPVSDRPVRRDYQDAVGLFMNVVPIRTRFEPTRTAGRWLAAVRDEFYAACARQQMPYAYLMSALGLGEGRPLFRTVLNYVDFARPPLEWPDAVVEPIAIDSEQPSFADLSLHAFQQGPEMRCTLLYKADVYEAGEIRVLADRFITIVENLADANGSLSRFASGTAC